MDQSQSGDRTLPPRPKNWLVESILVTIFCCLPFGIVGIVNAASVNSKFHSGDYEGALNSARRAGNWTKAGFGFSLALWIMFIIWLYINPHPGNFNAMPG